MPDPDRFPVLQALWQKLLAGTRPLELLRLARTEYRLTTPNWGRCGGELLSKSELYKLLRDPFYAGLMVRGGESYPGNHPPMITMAEFEEAQAILDGKVRPTAKPKGLSFTYRGLIRCGGCGAAVTAKYTKNRYGKIYTHYYCWKKERRYQYCPEGAVEERELDRQVHEKLVAFQPPPRWTAKLLTYLERWEESQGQDDERARYEREQRLVALDRQLDRLRDLLVKNVITEEDYQKDRLRILTERQRVADQLTDASPPPLLEPHETAISLLNQAHHLFQHGTPEEKRELVAAITWNLSLVGKKVQITAKNPFSYIGEWSRFPSWSNLLNDIRTCFESLSF